MKETRKNLKGLPINGVKTPSTSPNSPKATRQNEIEACVTGYRRKLRSSSLLDSQVPDANVRFQRIPFYKNSNFKSKYFYDKTEIFFKEKFNISFQINFCVH